MSIKRERGDSIMTTKITFVSQSVKNFVANVAMSGGDKKQPKIDNNEEYTKLKDFLSKNKDLPKNERDYVKSYIKEYEKNVTKAVMLESTATTKKEVINEMQNVLEQEEGIKISKQKIRKYVEIENIENDKTSFLKMLGYDK